ncbi:SDR family NAD(P)-dependent oxidoreductase [Leucobacter albus]|uniref:SDR family NAD(P)-dependent oxidoreductase n=1 Tax=Leucobacter albus TaxID=272210 RepID=A0ABW3TLX1_9MICO
MRVPGCRPSSDAGAAIVDRLGDRVAYTNTNVTEEAAIEAVVAATVERFGKLDIMFNNAGAQGGQAPIMEIGQAGFEKTLSLLSSSVMFGHKYAARQFKTQGGDGSIISTASAAAFQGGWSAAAYTVAKHGVVGIVKQATPELAPLGIRSNAIASGIIMTPIMSRGFGIPEENAAEFVAYLSEKLGPTQPSGRVGTPEDIAKAAVFLASDLSEFVNGVVLPVDGGITSTNLGSFTDDLTAAGVAHLGR